jgi:nucleoside 2-deoxyribosyltransferase
MPSAKPVFLALPDHNEGELSRQEALMRELHAASGTAIGNKHVWIPSSALGHPGVDVDEATYAEEYREALEAAEVVVAVLDGRQVDDGTAWTVGWASAQGTTVYGYWSERRQVAHPVITESCEAITGEVRELAEWLSGHIEGL